MKLTNLVFLTFICLSFLSQAQIINPTRFTLQNSSQNNNESFLLGLPNNDLIMFWYDSLGLKLKSARSTDNGTSWINENTIVQFIAQPDYNIDINAISTNSGNVLLTYYQKIYKVVYSFDNCISWTQPVTLPTRNSITGQNRVYYSSMSKNSNGLISFIYSYSNSENKYFANGVYSIESIDGINWTPFRTIDESGRNGNLVNISSSIDMIVYQDSTENDFDIFYRKTTDGGQTWSQKEILIGGEHSQKNVRGLKDQSGKIWLFFDDEEQTVFNKITQPDICFITSIDEGINWSSKQKFTSYSGIDENFAISLWNGNPFITFSSTRSYNLQNQTKQIYFGIGGETFDIAVPPFLISNSIYPEFIVARIPILFNAWVLDDQIVDSVFIILKKNMQQLEYHLMYDDGLHNDSLPGDNIYGIVFPNGFNNGDIISYNYYLVDNQGNQAGFKIACFTTPTLPETKNYLIENNKLKVPIDNRGILANVNIDGHIGLQFDESSVLFSGGFFISGENNNILWAAGQATSTLVENFVAGPVGSDPMDFRNIIYRVKKDDPDFGISWQQYRFAVLNGADFYDGDFDGIYNPVDLNLNGVWDINEDKPNIFGDETFFCIYNDGQPAIQRVRFVGVQPQGIEVQQTIFVVNENLNPIENMVFVRYRLINTGTIAENLNDVYFTLWSDPDIGVGYGEKPLAFNDDLVGCDTILNVGYCYNDSLDSSFGINPPALGTNILQGPVVYKSGETFIDINGNNIYDPGIDTPLDSAFVKNGIVGSSIYPGAKNLGMSSFIYTDCASVIMGEPNNVEQARYLMSGKNIIGQFTNPCNWQYGNVLNVPCNEVNPIYHYSGDPVSSIGWIHNFPCDQRMWTNVGPFNLPQNEKVDIWAAYIIGRGYNNLNSITKLKEYTGTALDFYQSNFTQLPLNIENEKIIIENYNLFQNYPNPFNPTTTIRYELPQDGIVSIEVFDILGQKIQTILNEFKKADRYEFEFNGGNLSSGVYLYSIRVNDFIETKKMMLLK